MSSNKVIFLLLCISFCVASFAQSPNDELDAFSGKFIKAVRAHEKQRALLVTDKVVFSKGENIWFKAFILNTISQKISYRNGFIFVDLVNEDDSVVKKIILDAANQPLNSRIVLPKAMAPGYYWLRAYTRQMVEEGDVNGMCVKPVYIGNNNDELPALKKSSSSQDSSLVVNFYPEGGAIMTGIGSTVAMHISNKSGASLSVSGSIKDNRDTTVTSFSTNINGVGKFVFEPSRYKKYKAVINWQGKQLSYPLPPFNFFAAQLSVIKQPTAYKFRILLEDSIYREDFKSYLIGVSRDSLVFASIGKGQYEVAVEDQKLPAGIAVFYLFDKDFKLLSERSVHVNNENVHINTAIEKNVYGLEEKVMMNLSITDAEQHPVTALVTLSIADTLAADGASKCSMDNLSATDVQAMDNFFLAQHECISNEEKDLFMLVKNNTYQQFNTSVTQKPLTDTDSLLYIKGTVLNDKKEPFVNAVLTLLSKSATSTMNSSTTDAKGHFRFPFEYYADSTEFAIQVVDDQGRTQQTVIIFDTINYPVLKTPGILKKYLPLQGKELKKYFTHYYSDEFINTAKNALPVVSVNTKKKVNYTEAKRVSSNSAILTSDVLDEKTSPGFAVLRVGGLHVVNGVLLVNGLTSLKAPDVTSEPLLLVDGVEISKSAGGGEGSPTLNFLNSLNSKDIDFIEVLKGPEGASYGVRGGNGVILVNMLNTRRETGESKANFNSFYATGVSRPVSFPNMNYQEKGIKPATNGDNRSTLFWSGNFLFKDISSTSFTFYTSDVPATYVGTIFGITNKGELLYKTVKFQSK